MLISQTAISMTAMDQPIDQSQKGDNWYEDLIADYDYQTPEPGQVLEGVILQIDEDGVLIDVGVKHDAHVPSRDLAQVNPDKLKELSPGDKVFVYVLNRPVGDRDLLVSLSKGIEHESWEKCEKYLENELILELEVIGHNRGGLIIEFENLRGFLPYSQVPGLRGIRSPRLADKIKREMVNTRLAMKVIEVVRERNRLIFSATAAEEEKRQKRLQELHKDDIILGQVVNIVDFGIFVDLDGIDGLVHLSELDWKRVKHPSELYKVGDEINVKVLDVDIERQRVSLSRKALLPSPWEMPEELPKPGDCIEGRVVKLVNFGAFVELPVGIEGLIHTSQLGYTHIENPKDAVKRGETVLVRVLDVDPTRRRISLSMRQVPREMQIAWMMEHLSEEQIQGSASQEAEKPPEDDAKDAEEGPAPDIQAEAKSTTENVVETEENQAESTPLDTDSQDPDTPVEESDATSSESTSPSIEGDAG